jgi:hypothetical protein
MIVLSEFMTQLFWRRHPRNGQVTLSGEFPNTIVVKIGKIVIEIRPLSPVAYAGFSVKSWDGGNKQPLMRYRIHQVNTLFQSAELTFNVAKQVAGF